MQSIIRQAQRTRAVPSMRQRPMVIGRSLGAPLRTLVTKGYTSDHETVTFDDETGLGTVTITDYAQKSLGDVVFVELPSVGTEVSQGDVIGAVESVKAASDIYAPVSGVIEEINQALADQPGLINKDPEQRGWLCKVKLTKTAEVEELLSEERYRASIESDN
ncbi:glycine cleavage H-protein-domain-containing protein [Pterulicium gracile]|uniref:Glycine cleavage system H protein n=1 Tax=Pterulicium gracile TaxID=1884261 RepID=A0A5C3QYW3_9AGAR|nr:glycine cleavage H-protein-domain-containing protein [Pterula gracilis]